MPADAVKLEKVPLKCQLPTGAAAENLVSFWVSGVTLAICLLSSVAFCAVLVLLAVVLVRIHWS